jgi:hypothetical protein
MSMKSSVLLPVQRTDGSSADRELRKRDVRVRRHRRERRQAAERPLELRLHFLPEVIPSARRRRLHGHASRPIFAVRGGLLDPLLLHFPHALGRIPLQLRRPRPLVTGGGVVSVVVDRSCSSSRGCRPACAEGNLVGEVEDGLGSAEPERGAVICPRGLDGGVVGAEPHARALPRRVADLRRVLAPRPLPHAAVPPEVVLLATALLFLLVNLWPRQGRSPLLLRHHRCRPWRQRDGERGCLPPPRRRRRGAVGIGAGGTAGGDVVVLEEVRADEVEVLLQQHGHGDGWIEWSGDVA